jgi:Zn-dependent oligopeptidase
LRDDDPLTEATTIETAVTVPPWDAGSLDLPTLTPAVITALTSEAIARANVRIDAAVAAASGTDASTFESLFGGLDDAAREVAIAFGRGAAQNVMAQDDDVRAAAFEALETIEKWRSAVPTRDDLGAAILRFVSSTDVRTLAADEQAYVARWRTDVRLAGAGLGPGARAEVARLTNRNIELGTAFLNNLVAPAHLDVAVADLDGVPADVVASFGPVNADGMIDVPVSYGNFFPVVENARRRDLRERFQRAWTTRGYPDNIAVLEEALAIRRRIAELVGYASWQALRAEYLAAGDAATINAFIRDIAERLGPIVRSDVEAMTETLRAEPGASPDLVAQSWDWRYADYLQRAALGVDHEALAEYLEFEQVLRGLAELSEEIFGVRLVAHPERTGWHPDVRPFDLVDVGSERVLGRLFLDPYVRHGKQQGAWLEILLPGRGRSGDKAPPTLSLCLNTRPTAEGPSLLSAAEVETLFHEFGHALNFALGDGRYVLHRNQWLAFDFVEGPSSFLGRWSLQPAVMSRFARHRVTGSPIPRELLESLVRAEALNAGFKLQRVVEQGLLDALLHGEDPPSIETAQRQAAAINGLPYDEGSWLAVGLSHICGGGYDAALYGYSWSEVIRDDLLERFESGGLTSPEMGAEYRSAILAVPWTADPVAAVNSFLGRTWAADALLARAGGSTLGGARRESGTSGGSHRS